MNIAITDSCGQKFSLLTGQLHDLIIWEKESSLIIIYIIDKETAKEIQKSSLSKKLKPYDDKFANAESFNSVYAYAGTSKYLLEYFLKHFKSKAEVIPRFNFPERLSPSISF